MDEFMQLQMSRLREMNVGFEVLANKEQKLEQRWEKAFAKDISKSQKRKMAFKQCMWNVFSWEKLACLKEQQAVDVFNQQKKGGCFLFYAFGEESIYIPKANRIKAKDIIHASSPVEEGAAIGAKQNIGDSPIRYLVDLYIIDELFTWTYILTHEEDCGPYFYKL